MDHVKCTGERKLESFLQQVDERRQRLDARAEWTQKQVESSTQSADWPSTYDQQQQPHESPTDSSAAGHFLTEPLQTINDMILHSRSEN